MNGRQKYYYSLAATPQMVEEVIKHYHGVIVVLSSDKKIQYVNENFLKLTGYDLEEILDKNYFELFIDPKEKVEEHFEGIISGMADPYYYVNHIYTKNKEKKLIVWNNFHLRDKNEIVGTLSFGHDITFREEYFNDIKEINNLVISLENSCLDKNCYLDVVKQILKVILKISGAKFVAYSEVVGDNLINICTEGINDFPKIWKINAADCFGLIKNDIYELEKDVSGCDTEFIKKHNIKKAYYRKIKIEKGFNLLILFYNNSDAYIKHGRISFVADILRNTEERKDFAEKLIAEKNKFFLLAKKLPYAVMFISIIDDKIEYVNEKFKEITGYNDNDILEKN